MSGGSKPKLAEYQSTEQKAVYDWALPQVQAGVGQAPYDLPSTQGLQPSQQWYQGMSPQVMAGIQAPYQQGFDQMLETMGSRGQAGSARGGYSGTAGAAAGIYAEEAARGIGAEAWQMSYPGIQAQYQAELGQNVAGYNQPFEEARLAGSLISGAYPTQYIIPGTSSNYTQWGSAVGQLVGTAIGSYYGGPQGAKAGGSAGSGVGSNVGLTIDKNYGYTSSY